MIQCCLCWQKENMKSLLSRINRIFCFYEHSYLFFLTWPESVRRKRTVRALTITSPPRPLRYYQFAVGNPPPRRVSMCEVPRRSRDNTHSWCLSLNCRGQCQYSAVLLRSCFLLLHTSGGGRDRSLLVSQWDSHLPLEKLPACSVLLEGRDWFLIWQDKLLRRKY